MGLGFSRVGPTTAAAAARSGRCASARGRWSTRLSCESQKLARITVSHNLAAAAAMADSRHCSFFFCFPPRTLLCCDISLMNVIASPNSYWLQLPTAVPLLSIALNQFFPLNSQRSSSPPFSCNGSSSFLTGFFFFLQLIMVFSCGFWCLIKSQLLLLLQLIFSDRICFSSFRQLLYYQHVQGIILSELAACVCALLIAWHPAASSHSFKLSTWWLFGSTWRRIFGA